MTKIIGHRGAAGLELQNSRASFLAAIEHGVDMIELDVRLTSDDKLVVIHDPYTKAMAAVNVSVRSKTLAQLQKLPLHNGEKLLSLDDALKIIGSIPIIIDLKETGCVDELLLVVGRHPKAKISIASRWHQELLAIRKMLPKIPTYALEDFDPIDVIRKARQVRATGVGVNKWIMNPLTYFMVRRNHMEIYVYTLNNSFFVNLFKKIYPHLHICTNTPERYVSTLSNN